MDRLAHALLERETLDEDEASAAADIRPAESAEALRDTAVRYG